MAARKMLKFYDQTSFTDPQKGTYGDCMNACIRTVLQMDLDAFVNYGDKSIYETYETAWRALIKALSLLGFAIHYQALSKGADNTLFPRIVIMAGISPRNEGVRHAVVWNMDINMLLHDPHPSRDGLASQIGFYYFIPHADNGEGMRFP